MPLVSPSALLSAHLSQTPPTRPSNRTPSQPRPIELNTSSLTHCNGSALVKIGATSIVCGVRAEILPISDITSFRISKSTTSPTPPNLDQDTNSEIDDARAESELALYNLLVPNLSLDTACSPLHPANTAPSIEAQSLSQRLLSLLLTSRLLRLSDFEIYHTPDHTMILDDGDDSADPQLKAYWVLYLDLLCVSHAGSGSVFDAAWLAVCAALRDTLLPRAVWDVDEMAVYCSAEMSEARKLRLRGMPVPLSWGVFEGRVLVDLDGMEEECCAEKGCVVVDVDEDEERAVVVVRVEKWGGGVVGAKEVVEAVKLAGARWTEWRKVLERT